VFLTSGMAWTQADADQVRAAIVALASGKRIVTVEYAGPPQRSVTYASAQIAELRSLLAEMDRQLGATSAPAVRLVAFKKGYDCG
jgi:hypothetical protein